MNCSIKRTFKIFSVTALAIVALFLPGLVKAEETTCAVIYGQGEVCGTSTTEEMLEHIPVTASVGDISFSVLAITSGIVGAALFIVSQVTKKTFILDR